MNKDEKDKIFKLDKKEICITSTQIKQAIDLLVNENELLQDKLYKQQDEIERLNNKYNKALELLTDFNMPCEMAQNKIPDSYCEENCDVDDESYKKCWDKYIELELKEGK